MKKILIIVVGLIAVILGAAAIAPKEFKIEKSITINKPVNEVFAYLKVLRNQEKWSPWEKMDPAMKKEIKGNDGSIGVIYSWAGNKEVGVGEMEIMAINENQKIDLELRFQEPMKAVNQAAFTTERVSPTETKVVWTMTGKTEFPRNLICLIMHGKVEKDFEQGLADLKTVLEAETSSEVIAPTAEENAAANPEAVEADASAQTPTNETTATETPAVKK